jgi:hypothetical protein
MIATMPAQHLLPPLILHPFGGAQSAEELLEGSKAALALNGLLGGRNTSDEEYELERKILVGRYQEIRMLLFLGKDIFRWIEQCCDFVNRSRDLDLRISEQSFAALVVDDPPRGVREKLERWGVSDRRAVFSRAIGIHSLFAAPPPPETLSPVFLRNYHRYADHAYICFQHLRPFFSLAPKDYDFELYASEEYARKLSEEWERS